MNARLSRPLNHFFSTAECESLLRRCATNLKSLPTTKKLHAHTITSGLLSNHFLSLLTAAYALCGHSPNARKLFDELPRPTVVAYKGMIRMHVEHGHPRSALHLFAEMHDTGCCPPDDYTHPFVIRACGDLVLLDLGMMVHGLAIKGGVVCASFVGNSLLAMYMKCGEREAARRVFDGMEGKSIVSWNTMISGLFRNGYGKEALQVFSRMIEGNVEIDSATILSVLPACGFLKDLEMGRQVHVLIKDRDIGGKLAVQNALIDMYVKCGSMQEARGIFDLALERDVVMWTTMINGYISDGDTKGALEMCKFMQVEGVRPNEVTLASLLSMCADFCGLKLGKCLHGWAIRQNVESDVNMETALINLYAKCGCVGISLRVFSMTSRKETVPWNAVLSGCIHNKMAREAIQIFKQMQQEAVAFNSATWKSLLPAYAMEADLKQATNIHSFLIGLGFTRKLDIVTNLIDVYAKCGSLQYAHKLFDSLPVRTRDIVAWSAIIDGYGRHGQGKLALSLFDQMVKSGVKPNEVTFTSVLHGCGHAGLVDAGLNLFNFMLGNYRESLRMDHYACIIDLLGRADRLNEAYELIKTMQFEPNHTVWGALLGACVIYENVELGEVAAEQLFMLEPRNTGNYVLMGNIYSAVGRFDDAAKMRRMMDNVGLIKAPGNSVL